MSSQRREIYQSKAWKRISKSYALEKNCLCERCGRPVYVSGVSMHLPKEKRLKYVVHHKIYLDSKNIEDDSIVYDTSNLELLCLDCHNKEHFQQSTKKEYKFDENGMLISSKLNKD